MLRLEVGEGAKETGEVLVRAPWHSVTTLSAFNIQSEFGGGVDPCDLTVPGVEADQ